jgi:hypothetical protein
MHTFCRLSTSTKCCHGFTWNYSAFWRFHAHYLYGWILHLQVPTYTCQCASCTNSGDKRINFACCVLPYLRSWSLFQKMQWSKMMPKSIMPKQMNHNRCETWKDAFFLILVPVHLKCASGFAGLVTWLRQWEFGIVFISSSTLPIIPLNPVAGSAVHERHTLLNTYQSVDVLQVNQ